MSSARPANSPDLVGTVPIFSLCPDCPDQDLIVPILELFKVREGRMAADLPWLCMFLNSSASFEYTDILYVKLKLNIIAI